MCTVCAVRCHAGHIIKFAKRSRFYCDCGAGKVGEHLPAQDSHLVAEVDDAVGIEHEAGTPEAFRLGVSAQ